jgi:inorganic pyrophosphatase
LPQTLAEDGDAVDAMVLTSVSSYPGVVVKARVVGALRVEQRRGRQPVKRNDRILVVPGKAQRSQHIQDIKHVPERVREEIQAFFQASLLLTGKKVKFCGWAGAEEAWTLIAEAHERYRQRDA